MYLDSQIAQLLHDEHQRTLDLMNRLEEAVTGRKAKAVPARARMTTAAMVFFITETLPWI